MLRSPERRERARNELAKTNLDWQFLDAVDGKLLGNQVPGYDREKVRNLLGFELTPGELGVFLSHKKAWQACVDKNLPTLIFEDDFVLLPHFEKVIDTLLANPQDWDLVRLQALEESPFILKKDFGDIKLVQNQSDALGLTASLVNPKAAKKLLEDARELYEPVDHFLEHYSKHGIRFLAVKPYPCTISEAPTTIYRPERASIQGWRKRKRSIYRWIDRTFSKNPWFPK
jgi:glycosyl transferase, family 25